MHENRGTHRQSTQTQNSPCPVFSWWDLEYRKLSVTVASWNAGWQTPAIIHLEIFHWETLRRLVSQTPISKPRPHANWRHTPAIFARGNAGIPVNTHIRNTRLLIYPLVGLNHKTSHIISDVAHCLFFCHGSIFLQDGACTPLCLLETFPLHDFFTL